MREGATVPVMDAGAGGGDRASVYLIWTAQFLVDALADGLIDRPTYDRLTGALAARTHAPLPAAVSVPPTPTLRGPRVSNAPVRPTTPVAGRGPVGTPVGPRPLAPVAAPAPSSFAAWFAKGRTAIVSDVAVHGLAYLGVLLVFAGTLGFLLFSFGSLARPVRPWAELAVPSVLLGSAAFLRRRGAPMVANALGVVGGLLLPVVLFASFVDGEPFPPELHGNALAIGVAITSLVLAVAYALVARRWRDVSVRFLVAPMVWTSLWGVGMLFGSTATTSLKEWTAAEFALVSVGVAMTAVGCARWQDHWLAVDARPALLPGAALALGMTIALAAGEDWPSWPLVVVAASSLVTSEALAPRLPKGVVQAIQPALLWVGVAGLRSSFTDDVVGVIAAVSALALFEWQWRRRPGAIPSLMAVVGVGWSLSLCTFQGTMATWGLVLLLTVLAAWAVARHVFPFRMADGSPQDEAVTLAINGIAATTPVVAGGVATWLVPDGTGYLFSAAVLTVLATGIRILRPEDRFLAWCVGAWSVLLAAAGWTSLVSTSGLSDGAIAAALALAAVALATARIPLGFRLWAIAAITAGVGATIARGAGWTPEHTALAVAIAGSIVAGVACWLPARAVWHLSGAGWVLAATGVGITTGDADPQLAAIAMSWLTAASLSIAAADSGPRSRGPLVLVRDASSDEQVRLLAGLAAPVVSLATATLTLLAWCRSSGLIDRNPGLVSVLVGVLGLVCVAATWLLRRRRLLARVAADGGLLLAVGAMASALGRDVASVTTLAIVVLASVVTAPTTRRWFLPWIGWGAATALVGRSADALGASPETTALALAVWAGAIGVGALVADADRAGPRAFGTFVRLPSLMPPAVIGLVTFPFALANAMLGSDLRIAVVAWFGAVVVALVARSLRIGSLTAASYLLVLLGVAAVSPWSFRERPLLFVAWAIVMFGIASVLKERPGDHVPLLARWDLPPFAVGIASLAAAVGFAVDAQTIPLTWAAAGVVTLVLAWRLRSAWVAGVGGALVLGGAYEAGHGWAALASFAAAGLLAATPPRLATARAEARLALRAAAAGFATFGLVETWRFIGGTAMELAVVALALAALGSVAATIVRFRTRSADLAVQTALVALGMQIVGTAAAWSLWPDRAPMVAAVLLAALEAAAAGISLRRVELVLLSPVLACVAWFVALAELLDRDPMWWTIPIGLTFLVLAAITRRWSASYPIEPTVVSARRPLEWIGMLTMLAAPLAQILTISPVRGLIAIGLGLVFAVWGIVTRVRRRLFVGAGAVVAALTLLLVGPIVGVVREIQGPAVWVLLAIAGVILIVAATSLERGRARLANELKRLDELLDGWE